MKKCVQCQHSNPLEAKFCNNCGARLESQLDSESLQDQSSLSDESPNAPRRAERRQLTIVFCDLVESTSLSEQLDPEEYRQVILDYHQIAEGVISKFGGYVGNYLGDGLLAYFGYPEGLEDAPMAGVRARVGCIECHFGGQQNLGEYHQDSNWRSYRIGRG